jgi:hypothetical protein
MLGATQSATRASPGQRNFGRVINGEYVTLSGSIGLPSKRCPPA